MVNRINLAVGAIVGGLAVHLAMSAVNTLWLLLEQEKRAGQISARRRSLAQRNS
ncbi:hypothetical protein D9M68_760670 [compost metagenome]